MTIPGALEPSDMDFDDHDETRSGSRSSSGSRSPSFSSSPFSLEDWADLKSFEKLTAFDFLNNLELMQRVEKTKRTIQLHSENLKKRRDKVKAEYEKQKERVITSIEFEKFKAKYGKDVDRLLDKWSDPQAVSAREKLSFVVGVSNIFITGLLMGGYPQWMHIWYTLQLAWFLPLRYYQYHQKGYHYFLADLCYFVNILLLLSLWVFPNSRRLFLSTYCLAYGNNAVAIAMWRNSMVFHSLDKVTSLFIHIMPPVTLHCLVHLTPLAVLQQRFPAVARVKTQEHYGLVDMILWSSLPYAVWQLCYHLLITVRQADKIAAGRPTSFTWLRKSYANTWIGKMVLKLPNVLQEYAFMTLQYLYALATMLPCPLWFYYRPASAAFISSVALWSVYNGATYYIDVFGNRFQRELEQLKRESTKWQHSTTPSSPSLHAVHDDALAELPKNVVELNTATTSSSEYKEKDGEVTQRMTTNTEKNIKINAGENSKSGSDH